MRNLLLKFDTLLSLCQGAPNENRSAARRSQAKNKPKPIVNSIYNRVRQSAYFLREQVAIKCNDLGDIDN